MYKCKICGKKYTDINTLYNHIEQKHGDMIPKDMSVEQYYYFMKTGKRNGNCVMCKQMTTWNKNTHKYNRFCGNPRCKEKYVEIVKGRMIAKYGKVHLLNDPNKQREMLANRKISGKYQWSGSHVETTYTGSYELDFLKTLDIFFDWDPEDISMPSPHTYTYEYEGEQKFYIPDAFIHSLDLEIEIKDGGDNPNNHYKIQAVDKEKERLKDEVMKSQKMFHYVKLTNKNYANFFDFLKEVKDGFEKYGDDKKIPRIFKTEDIRTKSIVQESYDILEEGYIINKKDLYIDFDKFINGEENICIITGLSGGGKSTLCNKLCKEHGAYCIELDLFENPTMDIDNSVERANYIFDEYFTNHPGLKEKIINNDLNNNELSIELNNFISYVINECKKHPRDKFIIEGLQIFADISPDIIKGLPIIFVNTSMLQSMIRKYKRDKVNYKLLDLFKWYMTDESKYKSFKKDIIGESYDLLEESIKYNKNRIWVSTDWHFYKNKDNKQFKVSKNIKEILNNYKKCVKPNDIFIFLGDLYDARTIFDMELVPEIFKIKDLKGYKIMIKGNHDVNTTDFYLNLGFDEVYDSTYNVGNVIFSHEPVAVGDDEINIHGHIHFSNTYWNVSEINHLDAYIEHYNFKPVLLTDLINEYRNTGRITDMAIMNFDNYLSESYDVLEEGMIKNKINAFNKRPYAQNMDFLEMSYELRKNDYDKLQHYFLTLAKNFNYEEDLATIKYFIKKTFDHYNKVIVNNPDLEKEYYNFKKWINKPLTYEVKDRLREIKESSEFIEEKNDNYGIKENCIYESSISLAYINNCLQNEYDELLRQYLQDYTDFYHRMLKERPDTVPHINDDIKRAIVFIDGLSKKGNVSNDLLKSAKWCLGDLVNLNKNTKPIKHSNHTQSLMGMSINTESFKEELNKNIWVGADWHFYTKYNDKLKENPNIDKIINNFNRKIKNGDLVIFIGDLYDARRIYNKKEMPKLDHIKKLKGYKIFVKGNHDVDPDQAYYDLGFDLVCTRHEIGNLVFTHEPVAVNENQINIHGHLHYCRDYWYIKPTSHIDVYTARFNYKPITVIEAIEKYTDGMIKPLALNTFNELFGTCIGTEPNVLKETTEISNSIVKVKVLCNHESRNIFTLNDKSSQIIINEHYVIQRDVNGTKCSITQGQCDETNKKVLEFDVVFNENLNIDVLIKEKIESGVQISSLFNLDDIENRFIREMSMKLFGLYPDRCEMYR